ncbi:conserved hypothetical protein, partial [Ricinus communis]
RPGARRHRRRAAAGLEAGATALASALAADVRRLRFVVAIRPDRARHRFLQGTRIPGRPRPAQPRLPLPRPPGAAERHAGNRHHGDRRIVALRPLGHQRLHARHHAAAEQGSQPGDAAGRHHRGVGDAAVGAGDHLAQAGHAEPEGRLLGEILPHRLQGSRLQDLLAVQPDLVRPVRHAGVGVRQGGRRDPVHEPGRLHQQLQLRPGPARAAAARDRRPGAKKTDRAAHAGQPLELQPALSAGLRQMAAVAVRRRQAGVHRPQDQAPAEQQLRQLHPLHRLVPVAGDRPAERHAATDLDGLRGRPRPDAVRRQLQAGLPRPHTQYEFHVPAMV